jgi:replicative DNA helicase
MKLFDGKIPPHNLDAEKSVLGALMLESECWDQVTSLIGETDFYAKSHQILFRSMKDLQQKGRPINLLTVTDYLTTKSELLSVGGPEYIADIVSQTASAVNVELYAQIIKEKSILRIAIRTATEIAESAYQGTFENIDLFIDQAEEKFFKLNENQNTDGLIPSMSIVHQAMKKIESLYQQGAELTGLSSGLASLDRMTSGFQPGELIIIAARPSMGKTAFSLNIAETMSIRQKKTVAYFALEMSKESLVTRLLALLSKINMGNLKSGRLDEYSWPRMIEAASVLSEAKLFIDETSGVSPVEIRSRCRRLKTQYGLDCIIIDYLQLMKLKEKVESREREVSEISRTLKAIAKELQIPVIALAQLNRGVEGRTEKRPMLSDLRESGSIEQDADLIMMLYRDDYYDKEDPEKQGRAEIIIGKQRNGPTGTVKLSFDAEIGRFREMESQGAPSPKPPSTKNFGPKNSSSPKTKGQNIINFAPEV